MADANAGGRGRRRPQIRELIRQIDRRLPSLGERGLNPHWNALS
jgi:hypothetical protein